MAAASAADGVPGQVVFRKGQSDDSDLWDDTALIKAYDDALNIMKAQLGDEEEKKDMPVVQNSKKHKKNRRRHKRKDKGTSQKQSKWNVGQHCRAVYTEDGQLYEAIIKSIDHSSGTCQVRFLGYGNEEEQLLEDLLPPHTKSGLHTDSADNVSENDSTMEWTGGQSPRQPSAHKQRPSSQAGSHQATQGMYAPARPPFMGFPPPMPPPSAFPMMPPFLPGMPPVWPSPASNNQSAASQRIPVVPPPPSVTENIEEDEDALHSMLIAWYMSGYHTGYYQGLKQGKKMASTSAENQHQDQQTKHEYR